MHPNQKNTFAPSLDPQLEVLRTRHRRPDMQSYYEGLETRFRMTEEGHLLCTYRLPDHKRRVKDVSESFNEVLLLNGGRNPPCGDYHLYIKQLLEEPSLKVDEVTQLWFPFTPKEATKNGMIVDPNAIYRELASIDKTLSLPTPRNLTIAGFCISADAIIYAMQQGLLAKTSINSIVLLSPGTILPEGQEKAQNIYAPFRSVRSARILRTLAKILPAHRFETPTNIDDIATSAETTFSVFNSSQPVTVDEKVPKITVAWVAPKLEIISSGGMSQIVSQLQGFASNVVVAKLDGAHGGAANDAFAQSYRDAIMTALPSKTSPNPL